MTISRTPRKARRAPAPVAADPCNPIEAEFVATMARPTEGFDTADLQEAKMLLNALS